jgi:cell wall-associated NlpC family hydrolase
MLKRFKLFVILCFSLLVFDSCQLIRRVGARLFIPKQQVDANYTTKEIEKLIESAQFYKGVVYKNGGSDESGMDCSGLLFRVYTDQNFLIPRPSYQQAMFGLPVSINSILVGDWIFFKTNGSKTINHVGLVTKVNHAQEVLFIHASTSKGVREDNLFSKYWFNSFDKVIRPYKNNSN